MENLLFKEPTEKFRVGQTVWWKDPVTEKTRTGKLLGWSPVVMEIPVDADNAGIHLGRSKDVDYFEWSVKENKTNDIFSFIEEDFFDSPLSIAN